MDHPLPNASTTPLYLNVPASETTPNIFQDLTFSYVGKILAKGQDPTVLLEEEDMLPLAEREDPYFFSQSLVHEWENQMNTIKQEDWDVERKRYLLESVESVNSPLPSPQLSPQLLSSSSSSSLSSQSIENDKSKLYLHSNNKSDSTLNDKDVSPSIGYPSDDSPFIYSSRTPPNSVDFESYRRQSAPFALFKALVYVFKREFVIVALVTILENTNSFVQALMVGKLLSTVRGYKSASNQHEKDQFTYDGYFFAFWMSLISFTGIIFHHGFFHRGFKLGMLIRQTLVLLIHRKSLKLHQRAFQVTTAGQIANMISTDVGRFDRWGGFCHMGWLAPLQVIVIAILVQRQVGSIATIAAVASLFVLMPLQSYMGRIFGRLRASIAAVTDSRIRVVRETIMGSRVMKQYAWEPAYQAKIQNVRTKEIDIVTNGAVVKAVNLALLVSSTSLVSFTTFLTFKLMGGTFTSDIVFVTISLLAVARKNLSFRFTVAWESSNECWVALKRISTLLLLPETDVPELPQYVDAIKSLPVNNNNTCQHYNINNDNGITEIPLAVESIDHYEPHDEMSIIIDKCTATWPIITKFNEDGSKITTKSNFTKEDGSKKNTKPSLTPTMSLSRSLSPSRYSPVISDLSLNLRGPQLTLVVGPVGSGKTSLCMLLLKELKQASGTVKTIGSVAYVSQQPWIMSGTVRDNIVMNRPYATIADSQEYDITHTHHYHFDSHTPHSMRDRFLSPSSTGSVSSRVRRGGDEWLTQVIEACALITDITLMPHGLDTEIGEKGVTLSGGQKARIALARACYADPDILLLDDPLSAVDPGTVRHLMDSCIRGLLKDKLVMLTTHQIQYVDSADYVVWMRTQQQTNKAIVIAGAPTGLEHSLGVNSTNQHTVLNLSKEGNVPGITKCGTLMHGSIDALRKIPGFLKMLQSANLSSSHDDVDGTLAIDSSVTTSSIDTNNNSKDVNFTSVTNTNSRNVNTAACITPRNLYATVSTSTVGVNTLLKKEQSHLGNVSSDVYRQYLSDAGGFKVMLPLCIVAVLAQCCIMSCDTVLAKWVKRDQQTDAEPTHGMDSWATTYTVLALCIFPLGLSTAFLWLSRMIYAAKTSHNNMLRCVLRAPLSWYDSKPIGQILNRFSNDINVMDDILPSNITDFVQTSLMVFGTVVLVIVVNFWVVLVLIPLFIAFYFIRKYYINASQQLKRLESITKSPIHSLMSATLDGLVSIRGTPQVAPMFHSKFLSYMRSNNRTFLVSLTVTRWFGFRLDTLSATFISATSFLAIVSMASLDSSAIGLSLSYVLQLLGIFQWGIRLSTDLEGNMVSTERVQELTKLPQEKPLRLPLPKVTYKVQHNALVEQTSAKLNMLQRRMNHKSSVWPPRQGAVDFFNLTLRYLPSPAPPGLNKVTVSIPAGFKVGIVGRTGSGKSTLLSALFRLVEPESDGTILIDGVDISSLGLHDLREQLTIIPQEPVLFSGTIRSNLDPFNQTSDADLISALKKAQLYDSFFAEGQEDEENYGLDYLISENGNNLSTGQRQLACLCRAIARKSKVLILDEATANVDYETDILVQEVIRTQFTDRTILVVAHRIRTIIDCDMVLVMDHGNLVEADCPHTLLQSPNSLFKSIVDHSGKESADALYHLAQEYFDIMTCKREGINT